jgi:alcohol dehydrogenase (NADP+)
VQIAAALGADTTVIHKSDDQVDDARRLGARDFRTTADLGRYDDLASSFDLIISTVPASYDLDAHLNLLGQDGTFVNLGVPEKPLSIEPYSLLTNRRSIAGSMSGGMPETQEMVDFCAEHRIGAEVEIIEADYIDEAFDRLATSDVRYRFVIDASTLADE